jgi:hypothetical protein
MDLDSEKSICEIIHSALLQLRSASLRLGPSAKWHVENAHLIVLGDPFGKIWLRSLNEQEEAQYIKTLPELISETERQDSLCQQLWLTGSTESVKQYRTEQQRLYRLLLQFNFDLPFYERSVRIFRHSNPELGGNPSSPSVGASCSAHLIDSLRLSIPEIVEFQSSTRDSLQQIDNARAGLVDAHLGLAQQCVSIDCSADDAALSHAIRGLQRAADRFDHTRGYRFATYAQYFVEHAIQQGRQKASG